MAKRPLREILGSHSEFLTVLKLGPSPLCGIPFGARWFYFCCCWARLFFPMSAFCNLLVRRCWRWRGSCAMATRPLWLERALLQPYCALVKAPVVGWNRLMKYHTCCGHSGASLAVVVWVCHGSGCKEHSNASDSWIHHGEWAQWGPLGDGTGGKGSQVQLSRGWCVSWLLGAPRVRIPGWVREPMR